LEPTGIKVLDDLLGGGFPRPSAIGITGPVGSGKSTLVKQIAAAALERDFRVQYYAIDESAEDVRESIASWGVDVSQYESEGKLSFVDMFALGVERLAESFPSEQPDQIIDSTMKFSDLIAQGRSFTLKHLGKKTMGIMDSLTPFFLMVEAKKVFQFGQVLKYATRFEVDRYCDSSHACLG
jgi:KaiC/GvpD/RAD55 family RecA-like ATPase